MKFKKNNKINTIEYFAQCICPYAMCSAFCGCRCSCSGDANRQIDSRDVYVDEHVYYEEINKYDGKYAEELAT